MPEKSGLASLLGVYLVALVCSACLSEDKAIVSDIQSDSASQAVQSDSLEQNQVKSESAPVAGEPLATASPAEAALPAEIEPVANDYYSISGILIDKGGEPVENENVYLYTFIDGNAYGRLGMKDGIITAINPNGRSDSNGKFVIKFDQEFVDSNSELTDEFVIGLLSERQGQAIPIGKNFHAVVFDMNVFDENKGLDFGKIVVE